MRLRRSGTRVDVAVPAGLAAQLADVDLQHAQRRRAQRMQRCARERGLERRHVRGGEGCAAAPQLAAKAGSPGPRLGFTSRRPAADARHAYRQLCRPRCASARRTSAAPRIAHATHGLRSSPRRSSPSRGSTPCRRADVRALDRVRDAERDQRLLALGERTRRRTRRSSTPCPAPAFLPISAKRPRVSVRVVVIHLARSVGSPRRCRGCVAESRLARPTTQTARRAERRTFDRAP